MAKPVKTNIAPPPAPPVTTWDSSNITADTSRYALEGSTEFQNYVNSLAFSWMLDGNTINAHSFDYIFMAANGMDTVDLTVSTGNLQNGIIVTGNGMDTITGNDSNELFFSGNGKDLVNAGGGNDIVYAGNGVDTVNGGAGNDSILGENGDDVLNGDAGDDLILGGLDNDTIHGGDGSDELQGEDGTDSLYGDAGNDDLWGGEGADRLDGGSDLGTASITTTQGSTGLQLKEGHPGLLSEMPTEPTATTAPAALDVAAVGIYVETDSDGAPTEFVGTAPDTEPLMYFVYSITPSTTGDYTIAYTGTGNNNLDGEGNPDPDIQHVHLEAGQTYYYSLYYDASNDQQVKVAVYAGTLNDVEIEQDGRFSLDPLDSVAATVPNYHAFFETVTIPGGTVFEFTAGDELTGEGGADAFVYDQTIAGNNVDVVYDYSQSDGDTLVLTGVFSAEDFDVINVDVDDDGIDDGIALIFDGANHAIALVGVTDVSQLTIVYDTIV